MKSTLKFGLAAIAFAFAAQAAAQVTFYGREDFQGRSVTASGGVGDLNAYGFADRASSVVVEGGSWEVCEGQGYGGRCVIMRPGRYPTLASIGMDNRIASVRPLADERNSAYRRRGGERLYEANVTSVRAIMGAAEQRCWVEREQVGRTGGGANVGGAIAGALIGGILGHQIGHGGGRDVATVGGAVAGGAIGANAGRGSPVYQDVQRCSTVQSGAPAYWDVSYNFRGHEHRVQMSAPPGATVTVNEFGEPRA